MSLAALILLTMKASIALNVLALGMNAHARDALYVLHRPALLLRSLLAMNVAMPLFAVGLGAAFGLHPVVKVALVALAVSPVPPLLPRKELKAGGHGSYAIGLLVAAAFLAVVLVPVTVTLVGRLLGRQTHVPPATIASIVASSVLLPLAVGLLLRRLAPSASDRLVRPLSVIASILLVVAGIPVLVTAWPIMVALVGNGTVLAFAAFGVVGLAVGHWLGGPDPRARTVLALSTASRHPAIAYAVGAAAFSEARPVMGAVFLYLIVSALVSLPYTRWRARPGGGAGAPVIDGSPVGRRCSSSRAAGRVSDEAT